MESAPKSPPISEERAMASLAPSPLHAHAMEGARRRRFTPLPSGGRGIALRVISERSV
jgi:hypothetical protein